MDFIDKEDLFRLEVGQDGREVARPLDDRPRRRLDTDAHFSGDEVGQARLAQSRRSIEEDVVEMFISFLGGLHEDSEVGFDRLLADELVEGPRPQAVLKEDVFLRPYGA